MSNNYVCSGESGACLVYRMFPFVIFRPTKLGGGGKGVASNVQASGPTSVCPHFVPEGELGNP